MDATPNGHPWSVELLLGKAKLYAVEMMKTDAEDWKYALFSAFVLEYVLRAALARISPALLAQTDDWRNIHYALHMENTNRRKSPKSVPIAEVIKRLSELLPVFTKEMSDFCFEHMNRRNEELHTGASSVEIPDKTWAAQFYRVCEVLLRFVESDLDLLLPDPAPARRMIEGLNEEAAKTARKDVEAHKLVWKKKTDDEKSAAMNRAGQWATRNRGHRVPCPSCDTEALLFGEASGPVAQELNGDVIVTKRRMLPTEFACRACDLRISGFSKLLGCGLGIEYTVTSEFSPEEHFELYTPEEVEEAREEGRRENWRNLMEEDFNEY